MAYLLSKAADGILLILSAPLIGAQMITWLSVEINQ